ncbi:MAG: HTTM domain-containing protein [Rickettsiales bacterium]|nr:HTTM domain-containing protein [Rickettsiales bacterium]
MEHKKLSPYIIDRLERSLKGRVISSQPVNVDAIRCYEETRILNMGDKPMPVVAEKCLMSDGSWRTGTDYKVQFMAKSGKILFLVVNPDTGKLEYLNK